MCVDPGNLLHPTHTGRKHAHPGNLLHRTHTGRKQALPAANTRSSSVKYVGSHIVLLRCAAGRRESGHNHGFEEHDTAANITRRSARTWRITDESMIDPHLYVSDKFRQARQLECRGSPLHGPTS